MTRTGRPQLPPDVTRLAGQIGAAVRARRIRRGLTVIQAAEAAGMAASTWYSLEQGRRCRIAALPDVAKALGCSLRDLMPR